MVVSCRHRVVTHLFFSQTQLHAVKENLVGGNQRRGASLGVGEDNGRHLGHGPARPLPSGGVVQGRYGDGFLMGTEGMSFGLTTAPFFLFWTDMAKSFGRGPGALGVEPVASGKEQGTGETVLVPWTPQSPPTGPLSAWRRMLCDGLRGTPSLCPVLSVSVLRLVPGRTRQTCSLT